MGLKGDTGATGAKGEAGEQAGRVQPGKPELSARLVLGCQGRHR